MKKVKLYLDNIDNSIKDKNGTYIGVAPADIEIDNDSELTLELVKQGLTVDEIIKLKNAGLI